MMLRDKVLYKSAVPHEKPTSWLEGDSERQRAVEVAELRQRVAELETSDTERKRVEEALIASEARFRTMIEENADGIIIVDREGIVRFANPAVEVLFDRKEEELLGTLFDFPVVAGGTSEITIFREGRKTAIAEMHVVKTEWENQPAYLVSIYDITERKRAEEELSAQALVFDNIQDSIIVTDMDGNIIRWNPAAERMFGYYKDEVFQKTLSMLATRFVKGQLRDGRWTGEMNFTRKDGSAGICETTVIPLRDEHDNITAVFGVSHDISDRKRSEEALHREKEKYRIMAEESPLGVSIIGKDGYYKYINPKFVDIFGYTLEDVPTGREWFAKAYADKEYRNQVISTWINDLKKSKHGEPRPKTFVVKCKDGSEKIIYFRPLTMETGDQFVIYEDITEREQAEKLLKESEEKYRSLVTHIPDVTWTSDSQGNTTFISPNVKEVYGYTPEEICKAGDKLWFGKVHPDDIERVTKEFAALFSKGTPLDIEYRIKRKDGTWIWFRDRSIGTYERDGRLYADGVFFDITERKQAERELQNSYHKLRDTMIATVNTLASTVEMRDPYTAGHQRRVTILASAIAEEIGLTEEQFDGLRLAGLIHDIGKITVPVEILNKPGRISETEFNIIKTHPQAGYNILKEIDFPWPVAQIILQHHERLDGSGYPQGLKDGGIMLEAKILAVADVVEAMASHRPYRPALGIEVALEEITKNRGVLYDPEVTDICQRLFTEKGFTFD
jgi:PAS domain S-box-containing protein/putative nucleotidyltransferase with HDIG domain